MARVEIASLSLGLVEDGQGNVLSGKTATITYASGAAATVYAAPTGSGTTTPTSSALGYIAGYLEEGTYTFTIGGQVHTVEVVSGTPLGIINVKSRGARGDGVTDDTNAIKAAIAVATAAGGGVVYFPAGTYIVSSSLAISSRTNVYGAGREATILKKSGNFDLIQLNGTASVSGHCTYSQLTDMTLHGNGGTGRLIDLVYADNITLRDLFLTANNDTGIDAVELWDSLFDNIVCDAVNSATTPAIYIRSSRAASGFGLSNDTSNVIRLTNIRCESWRFGALRVEKGTGGTQNPNNIWVDKMKAESFFVRGDAIHIHDDSNIVHLSNLYIAMLAFDGGFSTPQKAIYFSLGISGSIRNAFITNQASATIERGVYVFSAATTTLDNIVGSYGTNPSTGNHVDLSGGTGPYYVNGGVFSSGATRTINLGAGVVVGAGGRFVNIARKQAASLTDGTDTTPVSGTVYFGHVDVTDWELLTGISYLVGTVGGTNNVIVTLYDQSGAVVANSATAGTLVGTLATWQRVAFTATYATRPGRYFISVSFNGTTCRFRTHPAGGDYGTGSQAGTFGTLASITPPSTFTANVAPFAMTY